MGRASLTLRGHGKPKLFRHCNPYLSTEMQDRENAGSAMDCWEDELGEDRKENVKSKGNKRFKSDEIKTKKGSNEPQVIQNGMVSNNFVSLKLKKNFRRGANNKKSKKKWKSKFQSTYQTKFDEEVNKKEVKSILEEPDSNDDSNSDDGLKSEYESMPETSESKECSDSGDASKHLRDLFGFKAFREGQKEAVERILEGKSVLVKLATGRGKSLCYQLPAFIFSKRRECLCIVISPLISLMQDQLERLPSKLKGACLNSSLKGSQRKNVIEALTSGTINVLFLSPEMFVSDQFISLISSKKIPSVGIVCVDEAHCISEWSHNFRPAYLSLSRVIKVNLSNPVIVALTATATNDTQKDICSSFDISPEDVIEGTPVPLNLKLTISRDADKRKALNILLKSDTFKKYKSIIIYCTRQTDVNELSGYLQTLKLSAEGYHAGRSPADRKKIQIDFMRGRLRIIVATIAFGMGLDKSDVRSIIHYNLPKSVENYVQEIGRAGRDGKVSHCHVLYSGDDVHQLRSHCYGDSGDEITIKRLLSKVFSSDLRRGEGRVGALSVNSAQMVLDLKKEAIWTLLSGINEFFYEDTFELECVSNFEGIFRHHPSWKESDSMTKKIRNFIAKGNKAGNQAREFSFNIAEICNGIGEDFSTVSSKLRQMKNVSVSDTEAYIFYVHKAPSSEDIDNLNSYLLKRVKQYENCQLQKIDAICDILKANSVKSVLNYFSVFDDENVPIDDSPLRKDISDYFTTSHCEGTPSETKITAPANPEAVLKSIRAFVSRNCDLLKSGRNVARIFHGIGSPQFEAKDWYSCGEWARHRHVDFNFIRIRATEELIRMKSGATVSLSK